MARVRQRAEGSCRRTLSPSDDEAIDVVVAVPLFGLEIAPRFTYADVVLVARVDGTGQTRLRRLEMGAGSAAERLKRLRSEGTEVLVCGGFDRSLLPLASACGILVAWGWTGDAAEAIAGVRRGRPRSPREESREVVEMTGKRVVAVATEDRTGLAGRVSAHFGHCPYLSLVLVEDGALGECRVVQTPSADGHEHGAMPGFIEGLGVDVVIAGGMGQRAVERLGALGIETASCAAGNVRMAVEAYLAGFLARVTPCREGEACRGLDRSRSHRG